MSAAVDLIAAHWGADVPKWVRDLAVAIDREPGDLPAAQRAVARRVGYSNAVIHEALRNSYGGSLDNVRAKVERHLKSEFAECPILGPLAHTDCHAHQARKSPGANPLSVRLWRACQSGCTYAGKTDGGSDD